MLSQRFFERIHRYKNTGKSTADKKALQTPKRGIASECACIKRELQQLHRQKGLSQMNETTLLFFSACFVSLYPYNFCNLIAWLMLFPAIFR